MSGPPRIKELFNDLIELPVEARHAHLLASCGDDAELRERLQALLHAHESAGGMLAGPTLGPSSARTGASEPSAVGGRVGVYVLLERIGEGGFGTVYLAEQHEPVPRKVALKVIKPGMDSRQVIARFEAEQAALARMDHPHIARVLDAGTTDSASPFGPGRPYFAMELVKGVPVTQYCDEHDLSVRERLALFLDACRGVQHAHQKGIIHRDIKPSNVLVTRFDEKPMVKIIDFGIAKAITGRLTERTLLTEMRQLIGTPAYMSPEQSGLSDLDVDTRSDIYSLSVLLYELLAGTTPFDSERLRSASLDELRRIIREEEPPKPSTRLGAWKPAQPVPGAGVGSTADRTPSSREIARHRRSDPRSLVHALQGELDWIVMKGLEKDRTRRYETCDALALDIERYLRHEPVLASPPSRLYRLRKLVRRNRAAVVAGILVFATLLAGIAGTTIGLIDAKARRKDAEAAGDREREQRKLAEAREQDTLQISNFQYEMLSSLDAVAMGRRIEELLREKVRLGLEQGFTGESSAPRRRTPAEVESEMTAFEERANALQGVDVARGVMDEFLLRRAAVVLEERFADQPQVRSQIRFALGRAYSALGMFDPAQEHVEAALALNRQFCATPGPHRKLGECLYNLGVILAQAGRRPEAECYYAEALEHWRGLGDAELIARTLGELAKVIRDQGRLPEAQRLFEEAMRSERELYPEDHPELLGTLESMSELLSMQGDGLGALKLQEHVVEVLRRSFGDQDSRMAIPLKNLARILGHLGRHAEAESHMIQALAILREQYGDDHRYVAMGLYDLAKVVENQQRYDEAEEHYRQAIDRLRKLDEDGPTLRFAIKAVSRLLVLRQEFDEATRLSRESLEIAMRAYPEGHPESWRRFAEMNHLGSLQTHHAGVLFATDPERALRLFEEGSPMMLAGMRGMRDHPNTVHNQSPRGIAERQEAWEFAIRAFEFWDRAKPGREFGERAAELRAELKQLGGS